MHRVLKRDDNNYAVKVIAKAQMLIELLIMKSILTRLVIHSRQGGLMSVEMLDDEGDLVPWLLGD